MGCINGLTVDNIAAGGVKALNMALESTLIKRAKRSTGFGNKVIDVSGSRKKLLHK